MALSLFRNGKAHVSAKADRPPEKPDAESSTEADLLRYGDELLEYLESRYPLPRDEQGVEIGSRF